MNSTALRTLLIYAVILPLAVVIGWTLSGDLTMTSFSMLTTIVLLLLLPALLKWHHLALVLTWNTAITIFFLPGKPTLWMLIGGINFGIAFLYKIIQKRAPFVSAPSITLSLLALLAVVLVTGKLRGGFGLQSLGSAAVGGKAYYYILGAIIGYFGLVSQRIPVERARTYMRLFFLPGALAAVSNLVYFAGPSFYFLYAVVPAGFAGVQASTDTGGATIVRLAGFWVAGSAVSHYLMAVHGIRGILQKWWRVAVLIIALGLGTLGGYRSLLLIFALVFVILFILEGLLRSPIFPALLLAGGLAFAALVPFSTQLPRSVQRTLSILPLPIDPSVRADAQSSVDWRLQMWEVILPDLPNYFWLGKGYAMNPTDIYLTEQAARRGRATPYQGSLLAGDFHNGPLSVYVPFGIWGAVAFLIFLVASVRALRLNYLHGGEELRKVNRFLYAFYLAKVIFFFTVFGSMYSDLFQFLGPLGLSVALNGGICRKPAIAPQPVSFRRNLPLRPAQPGAA